MSPLSLVWAGLAWAGPTWVLSPQLLGDVLLLQIQDPLLFLLQPAEAPPPERRVLLHQPLYSHLGGVGAVLGPAHLHGLTFLSVYVLILESRAGGS